MTEDPRQRFSTRVDSYVGYRPGYPAALIDAVAGLVAGRAEAAIADIGSGTGIFTGEMLKRGCRIYAVEPNAAMRAAAEKAFAADANFVSVDGGAEATGLAAHSIDLITAAQAFHWFNNTSTREEFERILKPGGRIALIWNRRRLAQPFQREYDSLLREHAPEYGKVNHMNLGREQIERFMHPGRVVCERFDNRQRLDFDGMLGRLQSSSYCPTADSDEYAALSAALRELFDRYAERGSIDFEYDCELYYGGFER